MCIHLSIYLSLSLSFSFFAISPDHLCEPKHKTPMSAHPLSPGTSPKPIKIEMLQPAPCGTRQHPPFFYIRLAREHMRPARPEPARAEAARTARVAARPEPARAGFASLMRTATRALLSMIHSLSACHDATLIQILALLLKLPRRETVRRQGISASLADTGALVLPLARSGAPQVAFLSARAGQVGSARQAVIHTQVSSVQGLQLIQLRALEAAKLVNHR